MKITKNLLHNQNYIFGKFERQFIYNAYGYRDKRLLRLSTSNTIVKVLPLIDKERAYFHNVIFEGKGNRSLPILLSIVYFQVLLILSLFVGGIAAIVGGKFTGIIGIILFMIYGTFKRKSFFIYVFNRQKILGGVGYLSSKKIKETFLIIQGDNYDENN